MFDVMTAGSGLAREQPLLFMITTAGFDRNSICYEQHQKAEDILRGKIVDPTFYPVIYAADNDDDWTDPEVWKRVNPSYGVTIEPRGFEMEFEDAKVNVTQENRFRRLNLNQWVKQESRWMPMEKWDTCNFPVDAKALRGRKCYGGLDLSSTNDMTAFVLIFPPEDPNDEDDKFQILPYFWIPSERMHQRVLKDHVQYDQWKAGGFLETTDGEVINYNFVQHKITELAKMYKIQEIAFDRWGAANLRQNLEKANLKMIQFGQGYVSISQPSKELMRLVLQQRIAHGGNPVLRWNMDNIVVRQDEAGNIKPDKQKATEKIDGAVATIMALDRAIKNETHESVYNTRGIMSYGEGGFRY